MQLAVSKKFSLNVESILVNEQLINQQCISVENGVIQSITKIINDKQPLLKGTLLPGFIDLQVNGGGGELFNQKPNLECIMKIAKAHQRFGTTGWLPTLVTDSIEKMQLAADAVAEARKTPLSGVLGIHFEGPHLSSVKKGVHSEAFIRAPSEAELAIYQRQDLGKIMLTVAPEKVSCDYIAKLVAAGVIVCLGHSNATFEQTTKAIQAGATGFTHLFNAMTQFNSREPGMVGAALQSNCCYGLILDGIHVHFETVKLALNNNPNMMLVTDAMPPAGIEQSEFDFFGQTIKRQGDKLIDEEGRLAGSTLTMAKAFINAVEHLGLDFVAASHHSSTIVAKFLGLNKHYGAIAVGKKANFVLLNEQQETIACWLDGEKIV